MANAIYKEVGSSYNRYGFIYKMPDTGIGLGYLGTTGYYVH